MIGNTQQDEQQSAAAQRVAANVAGWVAVLLVTAASCWFAFWGVIEAFHEGWCKPELWMRLLQVLAYLSPAIVLSSFAAISIRWPRFGASLLVLTGAAICALIVSSKARFGFQITALITAVPVLVGLLLLYGRPQPRWLAYVASMGLPAVTVIGFGIEPAVRVASRFDDGIRETRLIQGNGVTLLWAPAGPGWTREGNVTWEEARKRARRLAEDGLSLADEPQDIWRLPTRKEVVQSLTKANENAGGVWNAELEQASYQRTPDKESPLWDSLAPLIYLWTNEEESQDHAWIVVYHGGVFVKPKAAGWSSLGFRAVRDAPPQTSRMQSAGAVAVDTEVFTFGQEQSLVDAMTKESDRQSGQTYQNDLDRSLSVLVGRAYPRPEEAELIRSAIDALCREVEDAGHSTISASQRRAWAEKVERTKTFESMLRDLQTIASTPVTQEQLVDAGLPAMLLSTGSTAAVVLSAREAEQITKMFEARGTPRTEPGVLGLDVSKWPMIKVLPGTRAADAGLQDGDIVVRINASEVAKTEGAADGLRALREAAHPAIRLTIERAGETITVEVQAAKGADRVKASVIEPGIVWVQIPTFEGSGIAERVNKLIHQNLNDATSAVILDLRDNAGGRPEEANGVADIFLHEKHLQIFQFGDGSRIAFKSKPGALDVQVILLTNRKTGSAAEMLVLALHDNLRATVIGEPTAGALFGKDFEKLSDGRMIVFRSAPTVLSPTGNDYSKAGFPPDILVGEPTDTGEDSVLTRAIRLIRTGANGYVQ
jgi:C-terminal peptidase prc